MKTQRKHQMGHHFGHGRALGEVKPYSGRLCVTNKARRGAFRNPCVTEHEDRPKWLPVAAHGRVPRIWSGGRDHCTQTHASLESVEHRIESILIEMYRCKWDAGVAIVWKSITMLPEAKKISVNIPVCSMDYQLPSLMRCQRVPFAQAHELIDCIRTYKGARRSMCGSSIMHRRVPMR